tara:strand:- start:397 stop:576 length:180 start_codon:yes stop_codon:yes gene_type:complete
MNIDESYDSKEFMNDVYDNLMKNQQHNPLDFSKTDFDSCLDLDDLTITIGNFKLKLMQV